MSFFKVLENMIGDVNDHRDTIDHKIIAEHFREHFSFLSPSIPLPKMDNQIANIFFSFSKIMNLSAEKVSLIKSGFIRTTLGLLR